MLPNFRIAVHQHFNRILGDLYAEISSEESHNYTGNTLVDSDKTTVKFQFYSLPDNQRPSLKVGLFSENLLLLLFRSLNILCYYSKFLKFHFQKSKRIFKIFKISKIKKNFYKCKTFIDNLKAD